MSEQVLTDDELLALPNERLDWLASQPCRCFTQRPTSVQELATVPAPYTCLAHRASAVLEARGA